MSIPTAPNLAGCRVCGRRIDGEAEFHLDAVAGPSYLHPACAALARPAALPPVPDLHPAVASALGDRIARLEAQLAEQRRLADGLAAAVRGLLACSETDELALQRKLQWHGEGHGGGADTCPTCVRGRAVLQARTSARAALEAVARQ